MRKCPCAISAPTCEPKFTDADRAFIKSLSHDEIFIQSVPSMLDIPVGVADLCASHIAPFMAAWVAQPDDDLAFRTLYIVWIALTRPVGRARRAAGVIRRRCERLARGGELQEMWLDVCPPRGHATSASARRGSVAGELMMIQVLRPRMPIERRVLRTWSQRLREVPMLLLMAPRA